jgi:hypothetical protein
MDEMAMLVKRALAAEDLSAFTELLDPDVTWERLALAIPAARTATRCWPGISGVEMLVSGGASMTWRPSVIDSS